MVTGILKRDNVSFALFSWAMGVILIVLGWMFSQINSVNAAVAQTTNAQAQIQVQLSQIQTDLSWIKVKLASQ